jgi:Mg2+/Co2+ transporter CorB
MDSALITGIAVFVLLLCTAFFSAVETALTVASQPLFHQMEKRGDRRAQIVNRLLAHKDRMVGAILLGANLVTIGASSLATGFLVGVFGNAGIAYATAGMTILVIAFGEVLPKAYAIHHAERVALDVAPVTRFVVAVFSPIVQAILWLMRIIMRRFGVELASEQEADKAAEELRGAIDLLPAAGEARHERAMLRSILDLADIPVGDVMHHRKDLLMVDADQPPPTIIDQVLASPFTRVPLYRGDTENIIGVLHAKALSRTLWANRHNPDAINIEAIAGKPWFIPESTSLLNQLQAFRQRREHFALVVDEYGTLQGVVTLEDILEEIVGDIAETHETVPVGVRPMRDGSYWIDGSVTIRDLNRRYEWQLPDENAATIAGLVIHEARVIPEVGQVFTFYNFRFEILRRQRNQITAIRLTPPPRREKVA